LTVRIPPFPQRRWQQLRRILSEAQVGPPQPAAAAAPELVFISHAAVDRALAERLAEEIGRRLPNTEAFVASRPGDIPPGEWFETVKARLRDADAHITIITRFSKERPWVLWENGAAWMKLGTPITTRLGIGGEEIPEPLRLFHVHALDDVENAAEVFRALGDPGQDLDVFCEQIAAMEAAIPRLEGAPAPIELRWRGGKLNGWNQVSRNREIHLCGEAPIRIGMRLVLNRSACAIDSCPRPNVTWYLEQALHLLGRPRGTTAHPCGARSEPSQVLAETGSSPAQPGLPQAGAASDRDSRGG
jgi:hypothetical protein